MLGGALAARMSPERVVLVVDGNIDRVLPGRHGRVDETAMQAAEVQRGKGHQPDTVFATLLHAAGRAPAAFDRCANLMHSRVTKLRPQGSSFHVLRPRSFRRHR
ncbi:MAG TPA: hypothetical protein VIW70_14745 [Rubrivivax sp.]